MLTSVPRFEYEGCVPPAQQAFYAEYGFIIYRGLFSMQDVETIRKDASDLEHRSLNGQVPQDDIDPLVEPGYDDNGRPFLHRLLYFTEYCPNTERALQRRAIDRIGYDLIGPQAWRMKDTRGGAIWQMKTAKGRSSFSAFPWHVDFFEHDVLCPAASVGIYLDDSSIGNGCLYMLPGSHRVPQGRVQQTPIALEARPGDVIVHTYRILHASGPMAPGRTRATLYLYFSGATYPGTRCPLYRNPETRDIIRPLFLSPEHANEAFESNAV